MVIYILFVPFVPFVLSVPFVLFVPFVPFVLFVLSVPFLAYPTAANPNFLCFRTISISFAVSLELPLAVSI
jgi:hypothetical protein